MLAAGCIYVLPEPAAAREMSFDSVEAYVKNVQGPRRAGPPVRPNQPIAFPSLIRPDPLDIADAIEQPEPSLAVASSREVVCLAGCTGRRGAAVYTGAGAPVQLAATQRTPAVAQAVTDSKTAAAAPTTTAAAENPGSVEPSPRAQTPRVDETPVPPRLTTTPQRAPVAAAGPRPRDTRPETAATVTATAPPPQPRRRPREAQLALAGDHWTRQVYETVLR
jgi:hypothetical protein